MRVLLVAIDPRMVEAWREFFAAEASVTVIEGDILQVACEAIVSPANSFGFMDGGLDHALSERFGWDLEKRLRQQITELPLGELLVGQALLLATGKRDVPWLISAPTMRIPTNFNIATSINAYLAMKAILLTAQAKASIATVAIPGLCAGVGRMQPIIAARQMFMAYQEIIGGKKMNLQNFTEAQKYHWQINPQGMIWTH